MVTEDFVLLLSVSVLAGGYFLTSYLLIPQFTIQQNRSQCWAFYLQKPCACLGSLDTVPSGPVLAGISRGCILCEGLSPGRNTVYFNEPQQPRFLTGYQLIILFPPPPTSLYSRKIKSITSSEKENLVVVYLGGHCPSPPRSVCIVSPDHCPSTPASIIFPWWGQAGKTMEHCGFSSLPTCLESFWLLLQLFQGAHVASQSIRSVWRGNRMRTPEMLAWTISRMFLLSPICRWVTASPLHASRTLLASLWVSPNPSSLQVLCTLIYPAYSYSSLKDSLQRDVSTVKLSNEWVLSSKKNLLQCDHNLPSHYISLFSHSLILIIYKYSLPSVVLYPWIQPSDLKYYFF